MWGGGRKKKESIDTAYHRLVTNKMRTKVTVADETHPLTPAFENRHTETTNFGFLEVRLRDTYGK